MRGVLLKVILCISWVDRTIRRFWQATFSLRFRCHERLAKAYFKVRAKMRSLRCMNVHGGEICSYSELHEPGIDLFELLELYYFLYYSRCSYPRHYYSFGTQQQVVHRPCTCIHIGTMGQKQLCSLNCFDISWQVLFMWSSTLIMCSCEELLHKP